MKLNRIILPIVACALTLGSCYDEKMEWGKPNDHGDVNISDIPLALAEQLANYDYIKAYAKQYAPNMTIGLGLGADLYISDAQYKQVADDNFQLFTTGNAMKHSSVVRNDGSLNFTTIDAFLNLVPADIQVYGHNFLWHTQQRQTYLKSLIAPEVIVEVGDDDVCENIVSNHDFEEGNANGWTGLWGKYTYAVEQPGHDSDYAIHFTMTDETAANYDCQLFWPTGMLEVGVTYAYSFWVKSDLDLAVQFIGQNASYGGIYKDSFTAPSTWVRCTGEFTYTESDTQDIERIGIQFGGTPGSNLWVDDFKFGKKIEEKLDNILLGDNSKFDGGTIGDWGGWGNESTRSISAQGEGYNSDYCLVLVNPTDASSYSAQAAYTLPEPLTVGKTYMYQAMVKATVINPAFQMAVQNSSTYSGEGYRDMETVVGEWVPFEAEFTCTAEGMDRLLINFGQVAGTYYIDNIKFGEKKEAATPQALRAATRAGGITYKLKTPEEKKAALLGAMEAWIKGMLEHTGDRIKQWDVINEPIADNGQWRGIGGNFMSNGDDAPDTAPVESEETGLNLNWAADHFYWGYYIGKEYAVKAFEYARKYAAPDAKLYVNDYNLETSPNKLNALIDLVNYIEDNGQKVDGIGTQMHVSSSITKAQVDAMFRTMAATGKLVRVTELDVQVGTTTPSAEQLATQAEVYRMIVESYKEHVPEAQQSGITIWTLTDSKKEHEHWLPEDAPNLFDANYGRKHAYKGLCDGIAGKDIGEEFSGDDWKNAYETEEETPAE